MDVRAKQQLSYQRRSLNFSLRGGGFAPRPLNCSASRNAAFFRLSKRARRILPGVFSISLGGDLAIASNLKLEGFLSKPVLMKLSSDGNGVSVVCRKFLQSASAVRISFISVRSA